MKNQIIERIKIAENFKSIYKWEGKTQEKKDKILKRVAFFDYGLVLFLLTVLIFVSVLTVFEIDSLSNKWTNTGILVLMTMGLSLRAPFSYIELMLKNHIKEIKNNETEFDKKLNIDLENIVIRLNNRKKLIYVIGIPVVLIFIAALLQVFDANPYWDKFPPLVLSVSVYLLIQINYDILKLKRNFKRVNTAI